VEVQRWRDGGESAGDYAKAHDVNKGTLLWWSRQLRLDAESGPAAKRAPKKPAFLAVKVRETLTQRVEPGLEVLLANGRCVRITGDFDAERVGRLLAVAEGAAAC